MCKRFKTCDLDYIDYIILFCSRFEEKQTDVYMYINPHEEEDARGQSSSDYKVHFYAYDKRSTLAQSGFSRTHRISNICPYHSSLMLIQLR